MNSINLGFMEIQHFNNNIDAIKCLKLHEANSTTPTLADIELLKKYVGWGSLSKAFPHSDDSFASDAWRTRNQELKDLLTDDEYADAQASITDSFYTPDFIISAMWNIAARLGQNAGIVLEPSCGNGKFMYQAPTPENMRFVGVEKDSLSARIAKYINQNTSYIFQTGFEKIPLQPHCFDLVIGNPPYGDFSLNMSDCIEYNRFSIHNQFILKSLQSLKHNHYAIYVVSRYVLDSSDAHARKEMSYLADLVGAYRLPNGAFKDGTTSNTEVITDILVFKRRSANDENHARNNYGTHACDYPSWVYTDSLESQGERNIFINDYFNTNPAHISGEISFKSGPYGRELAITATGNLESGLNEWIINTFRESKEPVTVDLNHLQTEFDALVAHLYIELSGKEIGVIDTNEAGNLYRIIEQDIDKGFRYKTQVLDENTVWSEKYIPHISGQYYEKVARLNELGQKVYEVNEQGYSNGRVVYDKNFIDPANIGPRSKLGKTRFKKLQLLIAIRDCLITQLSLESNDADQTEIEANRENLIKQYDHFYKKFGYINSSSNLALINDLPDAGLLLALENDYKKPVKEFAGYLPTGKPDYKIVKEEKATKAAIFSQRVIFKTIRPVKADNPSHALSLSLSYRGCVDLDYMAELLSCSTDEVIEHLHKNTPAPQIFYDYEIGGWVHKSVHLSGNVRKKLRLAVANGDYIGEQALEAVQPAYISLENISISLGMTWLPIDIYRSFVRFITDDESAKVFYERVSNIYDIDCTPSQAKTALYSTDYITLNKLLEHLFNNKTIRIMRTEYNPIHRSEVKVFDPEATELAISLAETIKQEFMSWLYSQGHLLEQLEEIYNQTFNSYVAPKFEGSHIILEGKVPDSIIALRPHQLNAVYRGVLSQFTLYSHTVGAGKTFITISRAMLRKQLGLTSKSMIIVPNHLVLQFAADVYRLFPSAKVLAATPKDFAKKNRKRLFARIATGNYDIVVLSHSSFEFIKLSDAIQDQFIKDEITAVEDALLEIQNNSGQRKSAKALASLKKRLEKKLAGGLNLNREDKLITFDLLGVNNIEVDEFHSYKNLQFFSNLNNIVGMGNPSGSYRAFDMYLKFQYLHSINGSAGCYTGTPVSNSAVELYNIKRFLIPNELKELGLQHFDNWARLYAENVTKFEATESGKLKQVTRFAREWRNLSSLMGLWFQFTDAISNEDLNKIFRESTGKDFPIPRLATGSRQTHVVKPTYEQQAILDEILKRYENLDKISDLKERNSERLRLMDLARKLSLAARCVNPFRYSRETGGKIEAIANNVFSIYQQWDQFKGTQLIFLDRSVPKSNGDLKIIKQYDALREKLQTAIDEENEIAIQVLEDRLESFNASEIEAMRDAQESNWSAYQEIKDHLVSLGIPSNEIRFIQEAKTDQEKQDIFDLVNSGEVRVLIGSTPKMGCGTNVQKRLVHLHHADVTFKPSDIEQREGRILRQGNMLYELLGADTFEIGISCYVTENSCDARMWELNSIKLKMIGVLRNYTGQHSIDFGAEADAISMKEIAALATGNPLMMERVELEAEIQKLERLKANYSRKQANFALQVSKAENQLQTMPARKDSYVDSALFCYGPRLEEAIFRNEQINIQINAKVFKDHNDAMEYLDSLKAANKKIFINKVPFSYTKAKTAVKSVLKNKSEPFVYVAPSGGEFDNSIDAAEEIFKLLKNESIYDFGTLFGLPLLKRGVGCELSVTTKDQEYDIAFGNVPDNRLTVINIATLLLTLVNRVGSEFSEIESRTTKALKNAKEIISQIKPKIGAIFESESELQYKKLRLSLVQTSLADADPESKLEELLLENEAEISRLQAKIEESTITKQIPSINNVESENFDDEKAIAQSEVKTTKRSKGCIKMLVNGEIKLALQLDLF
ncbi:Eco57I restriction-modification methylase domain-containing protein [Acinetobacter indicus]|uniref:Eco57I restriction-modification methylase domain-containing protein n=1 Tax=Acinetobacter indicus TaxID=756892 RepID=UPI003989371A